ncbi:hypothetical protein CBL_03355 [Carabus blaptoides fortunei]
MHHAATNATNANAYKPVKFVTHPPQPTQIRVTSTCRRHRVSHRMSICLCFDVLAKLAREIPYSYVMELFLFEKFPTELRKLSCLARLSVLSSSMQKTPGVHYKNVSPPLHHAVN